MNKIATLTEGEFKEILHFIDNVKAMLEHRDFMNANIHEKPMTASPLTNTARIVFAILDCARPQ